MKICKELILLSWISLLIASCDGQDDQRKKSYTKEELIEANKNMVMSESSLIDRYMEYHGLTMERTKTGIHYQILEEGADSINVREGDFVSIDFRSYLLDSTDISFSTPKEPLRFMVDQDDVVSGLHEGIKLLSPGDSARFIIPSYLGYGLTGTEKVPPKATLVYEIRLLSAD